MFSFFFDNIFWDVRFQRIVGFGSSASSHFKQLGLIVILAQHWSWVVQPCPAPLSRPQLSRDAPSSGEVWNPRRRVTARELGLCSLWRRGHVCTQPSVLRCDQSIAHDPWGCEAQKRSQSPVQKETRKSSTSAPWTEGCLPGSGLPSSCHPVTGLFCFGCFTWFSLDQKFWLLGCSFNVHNCIWWSSFLPLGAYT